MFYCVNTRTMHTRTADHKHKATGHCFQQLQPQRTESPEENLDLNALLLALLGYYGLTSVSYTTSVWRRSLSSCSATSLFGGTPWLRVSSHPPTRFPLASLVNPRFLSSISRSFRIARWRDRRQSLFNTTHADAEKQALVSLGRLEKEVCFRCVIYRGVA